MLDLRQLRYFAAIVDQGSFSRAAEALRIAQPSLSLHVRNMETELGTPLLYRSARGVTPTEAGAILLRHARIILGQVTAAEEEIRGHDSDPTGEVRLGLPGTISQILAVPLILPSDGHGLRDLLRRYAENSGLTVNTVIDVDSYGNIKALVREGMGYSILPPNAIAAEVAGGVLRTWAIRDPQIQRGVHLAHATDRPQTNAVRAVLALAHETLHDLSLTGQWAGTRLVRHPQEEV